jgi:hypothetical protein
MTISIICIIKEWIHSLEIRNQPRKWEAVINNLQHMQRYNSPVHTYIGIHIYDTYST